MKIDGYGATLRAMGVGFTALGISGCGSSDITGGSVSDGTVPPELVGS